MPITVIGRPQSGGRMATCLVIAIVLTLLSAGQALANGGGRARTRARSASTSTRVLIPLPDPGDVSYGVAQVSLVHGRSRPVPGSVFAQHVGGAAISATLAQWRSLRRTVHVYVVDSTVAGAPPDARDIAFFVVRARGRGPAARHAAVTFTIAGARAATGSFWVHRVSRDGVASVFTVKDLVRTAVRNWSRYLAVLKLAHALQAALHPLLPHARALAARATHRVRGRMWIGGERLDALTEEIFQLIFGTLHNSTAYEAAKRSPLVPAFIERELHDPALASQWRTVVAQLPAVIPDRFAAAAREETRFTRVRSPLISSREVVISDLTNSTTVGREQVPVTTLPPPPPPASTQIVVVKEVGNGGGLVTDMAPDAVQEIARGVSLPLHIDCGRGTGACSYAYPAGADFALYAQPAAGSTFAGWPSCSSPAYSSRLSTEPGEPPDEIYCTKPVSDCDTDTSLIPGASVPYGTYGYCEIKIPPDPSGTRTVTVTFDQVTAPAVEPLTVAISGSGSVTSSPAGINCSGTCTASFAQDQAVTLTATPAPGSTLLGWGGCFVSNGDQCTVTMVGARNVQADFVRTYTLTVVEGGTGGGSVIGGGIACPTTCGGVYDSGTKVTLGADSDATSTLTGWNGCDSSSVTAKSCTVTLNADRTVTATFTHNPQWMLDPAFGTGGTELTPVNSASSFSSGAVTAIAVAPNGDLVAVGDGTVGSGTPATYVVRYTPAGQLDPSFGSGGVVTIAESTSATDPTTAGKFIGDAVAIQQDGEIVVAGGLYPSATPLAEDFSMVRLTTSGAIDTSFATSSGGVADTPIASGTTGAVAVVIDPATGDIYLGGQAQSASNDFALAGYDPTGALLKSFGSGGTVLTPVGSGGAFMTSMILDDGDLVAVGHALNSSAQEEGSVAAYLLDGSPDSKFNGGSPLLTPIGTSPPNAWATGVAAQNGNQLVLVAGNADYNGQDCIGLTRLNADGTVDTGFGSGGYTDVCPNATTSIGTGVAVDSSGTIYVAGYLDGSPSRPVLLHFSDAGQLDTSFGTGGAIVTSPNGAFPAEAGPIVLDGGEVVIGGFVDSTESAEGVFGTPEFMLQGFAHK